MMKEFRLRVGWDIDGVGFNFGDSCKRYLDHIGQGHLWKSGPTPEPYWEWYKDWNWSTKEFIEFCNAGADAGFIFSGPVKPFYRSAIKASADLGHDNIVVTDRRFGSSPQVSENLTVEWFRKHDIQYDELIFSADKTVGNCDLFIDDKIENYDALVAAGTKAFLINRPWNQVTGGDARNRIDHIGEYVDAIRHVTNSRFLDLTVA